MRALPACLRCASPAPPPPPPSPACAGRLPSLARNALNAIYVFDPASAAALDIGAIASLIHAQRLPVRIGLMPVVPERVAKARGGGGGALPAGEGGEGSAGGEGRAGDQLSPSEKVGRLLLAVRETFGAPVALSMLGQMRAEVRMGGCGGLGGCEVARWCWGRGRACLPAPLQLPHPPHTALPAPPTPPLQMPKSGDEAPGFEERAWAAAQSVTHTFWNVWASQAATEERREAFRTPPEEAIQEALDGRGVGRGAPDLLAGAAALALTTGVAGGSRGWGGRCAVGGIGRRRALARVCTQATPSPPRHAHTHDNAHTLTHPPTPRPIPPTAPSKSGLLVFNGVITPNDGSGWRQTTVAVLQSQLQARLLPSFRLLASLLSLLPLLLA